MLNVYAGFFMMNAEDLNTASHPAWQVLLSTEPSFQPVYHFGSVKLKPPQQSFSGKTIAVTESSFITLEVSRRYSRIVPALLPLPCRSFLTGILSCNTSTHALAVLNPNCSLTPSSTVQRTLFNEHPCILSAGPWKEVEQGPSAYDPLMATALVFTGQVISPFNGCFFLASSCLGSGEIKSSCGWSFIRRVCLFLPTGS